MLPALFLLSLNAHAQSLDLTLYNMANTPVYTTNNFKTIGVGKGGYIYAGTANAGLYKFNGVAWSKMTVLTNNNINDIQVDKNEGIWIAQYGTTGAQATTGGANYLPDSTQTGFAYYGATNGLPTRNCRGIFIDTAMLNQGNPRVWTANMAHITAGVSTTGAVGLGLNTVNPFFGKITAGIDISNDIGSVQTIGGSHNEVWAFASVNFGKSQICRYDPVTTTFLGAYDYTNTTVTGFTNNFTAKSIYFDSYGRQWIGLATGGVIVKDGAVWTSVNMGEIFPLLVSVNTNAISEDQNKNIYIGTNNGLVVYKGGPLTDIASYTRYTTSDGLPSNNVLDICEQKTTGKIIVATDNGIVFWKRSSRVKADLVWDYSFPHKTVQPRGVAADGVARLYLKVKKAIVDTSHIKEVRVSLKDTANRNNSLWGRLLKANQIQQYSGEASLGGSGTAFNIDSTNLGEFWFWYRSPENFNCDNCSNPAAYGSLAERADTIKIKVTFADNSTDSIDFVVQIIRPPLVLVHGLASEPAAWDKFYYNGTTSFLQSPLFKQKKALELSGKASFLDNARRLLSGDNNSLTAEQKLKSTLEVNIAAVNELGYASNQVDYVCHSMGGLMLRYATERLSERFYANGPEYKFSNYGKGFVHKFISINTPHNSSPVADAITEFIPDLPKWIRVPLLLAYIPFQKSHKPYDWFEPDPAALFTKFRATAAVRDLQVTDATGGINMKNTHVKNHLILGDVNYDGLNSTAVFLAKIKPVLDLLDKVLDVAIDKTVPPPKIT